MRQLPTRAEGNRTKTPDYAEQPPVASGLFRMCLPVTNRLYFLTALFSLAVLAKGSVVINEIYYKPLNTRSRRERFWRLVGTWSWPKIPRRYKRRSRLLP